MKRYRVTYELPAADDAEALLRAVRGAPVTIPINAVFETRGAVTYVWVSRADHTAGKPPVFELLAVPE